MFSGLDETAADVPVRDVPYHLADPSANQIARARQDVSRLSREELEDRFLRVHDETLVLKQRIHKQEDTIKKLGTKLMRLVKDRGRMEQLARGAGGVPAGCGQRGAGGVLVGCGQRDVEMEELLEELQEKVRSLQAENEGVRRRLLLAKQQLIASHSRRAAPYGRMPPRVNSSLKKPGGATPPPQAPSKSSEGGARPPTGLLPRFGHSLLEEAREEVRNLERLMELQRIHMEEAQAEAEQLREELRRKEAQYQDRLLQVRDQHTSRLRSQVHGNVEMIRLQKQLSIRTDRTAELEGRFLQLQESQRVLKVSHEAAMLKVDQLSAQLKAERQKSLDLEGHLQTGSICRLQLDQLQDRVSELEQERDLLKDHNDQLVHRALDGSQQQRTQTQEQQLQIAQLEAALKADLQDKNQILDQISAERDSNRKLTEDNRRLHLEMEELKQQLEKLQVCSKEELHKDDLTQALLLLQKQSQSGDLGFLQEVQEGGGAELRAAHAETIQELQKTRNLLLMEARISQDYQAELQAALEKMAADRAACELQLQRQAALLESKTTRVQRLEAQLLGVAYSSNSSAVTAGVCDEDEAAGVCDEDEAAGVCDEDEAAGVLGEGENLVELQVVGASLSPAALQILGSEPRTFCTYSFYLFEPHATPVATGRAPVYGFTSRYVVTEDERLRGFLRGGGLTLELHQALGLDWRTRATGRIPMLPLLQRGHVTGSLPLVGVSEETRSFGSLDYWMRLKVPMTELNHQQQVPGVQVPGVQPGSWNELLITVHRCRDLKGSGGSRRPSPYVVYKFYDFPDYPTPTVQDCCHPVLDHLKSFSVPVDADLDRYLRAEALQLYVFDDKEEQMDTYLGKSRVPLLPLTRDQGVTGAFPLTDPSGLAAGLIEVTLKWRSSYVPPSASIMATEEEEEEEALQEEGRPPASLPEASGSKAEPTELRLRTRAQDGPAAKKVSFVDPLPPEDQEDQEEQVSSARPHSAAEEEEEEEQEEEEEEEESHFSEGQLDPAAAPSPSDDSEVSEDMVEDTEDLTEVSPSDSDDGIVHGRTAERKPSQRVRVEVVSLSLRPESRASLDDSVVRLFVEYSLLDLPTEETPLALPKPARGKSINYNYSKVVPVDSENHAARRQLLRRVLQGRNPLMERIRFTVVSEPPEEEEQERECEDVGVAFIRIPEILERQQDLTETSLEVVDVEDSSQVVGSLIVTVEGLEALQAIMEDPEHDQH
ncbi:protein fantom isoform X2 [Clinocottus analis]|uniref:protein fantom isoform X2 n=1 Tax=Clinocottus analis TaxID=304258 RepID=UPI0035BF7780